MPKTIDPETLDIHDFEKKQIDIEPITKKEKINPRTLKGIGDKPEKAKPHKKFFIAILGNIVLPGLGNVVLKRKLASTTILALNIIFLILTVSPVSLLGFIGNVSMPQRPRLLEAAVFTIQPEEIMAPLALSAIYLPMIVATIAWLHLAYLILNEGNKRKP